MKGRNIVGGGDIGKDHSRLPIFIHHHSHGGQYREHDCELPLNRSGAEGRNRMWRAACLRQRQR
jgi:hypothetical protein